LSKIIEQQEEKSLMLLQKIIRLKAWEIEIKNKMFWREFCLIFCKIHDKTKEKELVSFAKSV